jgi:hypothetical protein
LSITRDHLLRHVQLLFFLGGVAGIRVTDKRDRDRDRHRETDTHTTRPLLNREQKKKIVPNRRGGKFFVSLASVKRNKDTDARKKDKYERG